ncbi:MAG: hypothetical protein ACM3O7_05265 [Acidobacteriota bacterium]
MKRPIVLLVVAVLALSTAGTAFAVEPPKAPLQARALKLEDAKLPVAELKKLQPPPNLRIQAVARVKPVMQAIGQQGPDLVPLPPLWVNPARPGPSVGFPAAQFQGWRANWRVKNIGNQVAGPPNWKVHFSCEVINVPPGTEYFELYTSRWCSFSEGTFNMPGTLAPNAQTPPEFIKIFVGYPLFPCAYSTAPKPRITFKVDSGSTIPETRENNNEYQIDVCLGS